MRLSANSAWAGSASDGDFDLLRLDRQRQSTFRTHFQAKLNRFLDILHRLGFSLSLANTAGNRWTLSYPSAGLIAINRHGNFIFSIYASRLSPQARLLPLHHRNAVAAGNHTPEALAPHEPTALFNDLSDTKAILRSIGA